MPSILKKMFSSLLLGAAILFTCPPVHAQAKLSIDKVYSTYLRNSGTIIKQGQIKGYFFFYQSDKIDRSTIEYTLQILDENLNKVKNIKFQDSKKVNLLEAAYNGASLSFFFKNEDTKTLDMKIYDLDGALLYTYSRPFDKRTDDLMKQYETLHTDEGTNKNVFDLGEKGYASVLPLRDGKIRTYEVDYYSSESKKQWTYEPSDDAEKYAGAEYLGSTDSLIILEVMKKNSAMSSNISAHLVGINFVTKKKQFDIDNSNDKYTFYPASVTAVEGTNKTLVMGTYYDKSAKIEKDASLGIALYEVESSGKVVTRAYNAWGTDMAKYLPTNSKGKIDDVGFLYIHKMVRTADGKLFVIGEGYKRQASAGGIALAVLSRGRDNFGVTKIVITDMVLMEFNDKYKVVNAKIYDKTDNDANVGALSDYNSQHALSALLKAMGAFDYEFTTTAPDNSSFTVCYSDWVRTSEYKGKTFNSIRYDGSKFSTDKIELKSKASTMQVFPAKAGSVMILEYFKKDKRIDFRLEKLG